MSRVENQPQVSIVVPVFNAEKFLAETIQTISDQTYENWELLLINDCSTDNSEAVAKTFLKDKRIHWINLKKNSGAAISRNKGIELADGRYIVFIDADDLWKKNKLEKQLSFMQKKDCAFSFTSYEFADENGKPNGKKAIVPKKISYKQALKNTTIFTSTVMLDMNKLSKETANKIYLFSYRWKILKKIDFAYGISEIYTYYRRSKNTLSSSKTTAIKRIWFLYRKVEKLNLLTSSYCFCFYAINAVRRRV